MNRIALVEDHDRLAGLIQLALRAAGIEVDVFGAVQLASRALDEIDYEVVVIDRGLPDGDGLALVKRLRQAGKATPCLMLTARDALHDRVEGLESGADDYLTKPFAMTELVARVRALMRRPPQLRSLEPRHGDIQVHPDESTVRCGQSVVALAPAELQIMLCLIRRAEQPVRRTALEAAGWGLSEAVTPNALDVALHRLRRKLQAINSTLQIVNIGAMAMSFVDRLRPSSLRARLLVTFVAGMLLSAGIVTVAVMLLLHPFSEYMLRSGIKDNAQAVARYVAFDTHTGEPVGVGIDTVGDWVFTSLGREVELRILDDQGRVAYPRDVHALPLTPDGGRFDPRLETFTFLRDGIAMHASTVSLEHGGRRWYTQFAVSDRFVLLTRRSIGLPALTQGLAATCALFLVIFLVTTHFTLRVALTPLRIASETASGITPRTLDARLDAAAQPREIRPLVEAFNQTLKRLAQGLRTQQEFLASAAHELKTPLALIRAQIELGAPGEQRNAVLGDIDLMGRQVQQLLILAEVSEPQSFRIALCDPRPTFQEAFDFMTRVADQHAVFLAIRIADDVKHWYTDRGALFTMLKNLLENAIQHSPSGGIVALNVTASGFSIKDEGSGVPAANLPFIFDRFWRGRDRQHSGAGLGLAICKEIAVAHGWQLSAQQMSSGLQLTAVVDEQANGRSSTLWRSTQSS